MKRYLMGTKLHIAGLFVLLAPMSPPAASGGTTDKIMKTWIQKRSLLSPECNEDMAATLQAATVKQGIPVQIFHGALEIGAPNLTALEAKYIRKFCPLAGDDAYYFKYLHKEDRLAVEIAELDTKLRSSSEYSSYVGIALAVFIFYNWLGMLKRNKGR